MFVIGLTGSAGMGKSTVAGMFAEAGAAVFDADAAVHRLYAGAAVGAVLDAFPDARGHVGDAPVIDRSLLAQQVFQNPPALKRLEAIVHPLVRAEEDKVRLRATSEGRRILVLDVPLLLETGGADRVDAVLVVSAPAAIQEARLRARPGMTEERLAAMAKRQMPDDEKRKRAHFIVDTSGDLDLTRRQVRDVLRAIAGTAAGR
jgi:dephospho-CoA kinase